MQPLPNATVLRKAIQRAIQQELIRHLRRFNGIPRQHFGLFLKECEWRFNCSDPKEKLRQLKQWIRKNMG